MIYNDGMVYDILIDGTVAAMHITYNSIPITHSERDNAEDETAE